MKKIVFAFSATLFLSGCATPEQITNQEKINKKVHCIELAFAANNPENLSKNYKSCMESGSDPLSLGI